MSEQASEQSGWTQVVAPDRAARVQVVAVSVAVSALLLMVHTGINNKWQQFTGSEALTLWYTTLIPAPVLLALLMETARDRFAWGASAIYLLLMGILAWHTGHATSPDADPFNIFSPYVLALVVSTFIVAAKLQAWRRTRWAMPYAAQFQNAANNAFSLAVMGLFTGIAWLILFLWAQLFQLLKISFFSDMFQELNFIYPVTGLFAGIGLVLGRELTGVARTMLRVGWVVARGLLPVVAFVCLIFLAALVFNSLTPLWDTGHATALINSLVIVNVLLVNAIWQEGASARPYPRALQWMVNAGLAALPVFAGISLYAVSLRVQQYGWTVDRLWGALTTIYVTQLALGYCIAALLRRTEWLAPLGRANSIIAALIAVTLLMTQSPLLDFRAIAVHSHIARTEDPWKLDLKWLRFDAGRPGYEALLALKTDPRITADHALLETVDEMIQRKNRYNDGTSNLDYRAQDFRVLPQGTAVPAALLETIKHAQAYGESADCKPHRPGCVLLKLDLKLDGGESWLLFNTERIYNSPVFVPHGEGWALVGHFDVEDWGRRELKADELTLGSLRTIAPQWKELDIGGSRLRFKGASCITQKPHAPDGTKLKVMADCPG